MIRVLLVLMGLVLFATSADAQCNPVAWQNAVNLSGCTDPGGTCVNCGSLTCSVNSQSNLTHTRITTPGDTAWDAGASSTVTFAGDMTVQWSTNEVSSSTVPPKFIGLSHGDTNANYTSINYGMDLATDGHLYAFELGTQVSGQLDSYAPGDTMGIVITSGVVTFWHNGSLMFTSSTPASGTYLVDTSFFSPLTQANTTTLTNVVFGNTVNCGAASPTPTITPTVTVTVTAVPTTTPVATPTRLPTYPTCGGPATPCGGRCGQTGP